jgi:PleD family two-component response regulator
MVALQPSRSASTFDPNRAEHPDVESLARAADRALYQAKTDGQNRVAAA